MCAYCRTVHLFLTCVGGGIPYCNVSESTEDCSECYPPFMVMKPLHFQEEIRLEAEEKAEEIEEMGGHFKKNCLEHAICLTEREREGAVLSMCEWAKAPLLLFAFVGWDAVGWSRCIWWPWLFLLL